MSQPDRLHTSSILLNALSGKDRDLLTPHLTRVDLPRGMTLVEPDTPVAHAYFPEGGVVSIVPVTARGERTGAGLLGRERVSATCLLLGTDRTPHESVVQVGGATALRIDTAPYLAAVRRSESLRTVLLRYVHTLLVQTAQSGASDAAHRMEARLARWLLMCHDRTDGDEIALTHDAMGMMISAGPGDVTATLCILEGAGMIRSGRGLVVIRDRDALKALAGAGYGLPEAEYRRLIGPPGEPSVSPPDGRAVEPR